MLSAKAPNRFSKITVSANFIIYMPETGSFLSIRFARKRDLSLKSDALVIPGGIYFEKWKEQRGTNTF